MYSPGEVVEYYSVSQGGWIPATILGATAQGTFNLDCKPGVAPDKIRKRGGGGALGGQQASPAKDVHHGSPYTAPPVQPAPAPPSKAASAGPSARELQPIARQPAAKQLAVKQPSRSQQSHASAVADALESGSPVQLLSVKRQGDKWWYEVCPDGAAVLERHGSRRIAVVSVCGLYRTGKSYILNLLLERVQRGLSLFQVGNTTNACTEGMWLYGAVDQDNQNSPLLAYIDCEGFGSTDSDLTRDAQLMTLCSLLSSVLVLNTKGALSERTFNALSLTCRFAEHIEERGNESSRPTLLWLLRDFQLDLIDANGSPISPTEYLEQALNAAPLVGHDADRGRAAHEVRQSLLRFFGTRKCVTLVRPVVEEGELQQLEKVPYDRLRQEFRGGVDQLRKQLLVQCQSNPKAVGGHAIGCVSFIALMRQLVKAMNDNAVLNVKGAWDTIQHNVCADLTDELRATACGVLRALASGEQISGGAQLPLADDALEKVLQWHRRELKSQWDERAVGEEVIRREYWQELESLMEPEESMVRKQNVRIAQRMLGDACTTWHKWLDDDNGVWPDAERILCGLKQLMERTPAEPLRGILGSVLEQTGQRVARERKKISHMQQQGQSAMQATAAEFESALEEARSRARRLQEEVQALREESAALKRNEESSQGAARQGQAELHQAKEAVRSLQEMVQLRDRELQQMRTQLQTAMAEKETSRGRESEEIRKLMQLHAQKETHWREQLDYVKEAAAKSEAAALKSDREARKAQWEADHLTRGWEHEKKWLQDEVRRLGGRI